MKTYTQLLNELTLGTKIRAQQARLIRTWGNPSQRGIDQSAKNMHRAHKHAKKLIDAGDISPETAKVIYDKHSEIATNKEMKRAKANPYRHQQLIKNVKDDKTRENIRVRVQQQAAKLAQADRK